MAVVDRISLSPEMSQHVMAASRGSLVAKSRDVNGRDDYSLAGAGRRLRQHPPIVIYNLAAARPRVWRIELQARALIRRYNVSRVFNRATTIHYSPPVHRLRRAPRVHVRRYAHEHFSAVCGQLANRFGEQPVITNRAAYATYF